MAARKRISKIHWDSIVDGISDGLTVPFLGAGVNAGGNGYSGLPVGTAVARSLLEKLIERKVKTIEDLVQVTSKAGVMRKYPDLVRTRLEDLARIALHVELEGDNTRVVNYLKEILPDAECQPSELLKVIARLPFRLVVTTNYDRLLERAFAGEEQPKPLILSQPVDGFSVKDYKDWQKKLASDERIIYKLHGSFDDAYPQLVISEEDYIEFMGLAGNPKRGVPTQIKERIASSTLLFLGYGLEDWDVRSIYKVLIEQAPRRAQLKSFAIQKDPSPFWVKFWDHKKVEIYNIDLHDFAGQLEAQWKKRH
jgi:hypothetical protein